MQHKLIDIRNLTSSTFVLRLEKNGFSFKPGQCVNLGVKGTGINREYSTYSGVDDPYLEFLIKEVSGGAVSPSLRKVCVGNEIDLHGPYGSFVLDPEKIATASYVFIGTGTGVAPYHSYVRSFPNLDCQIIAGIRYDNERYDQQDYDPSQLTYCISREKGDGFQGRVTDYLKSFEVKPNHVFYLCGNNRMINDTYDLLRNNGATGHQVISEAFF